MLLSVTKLVNRSLNSARAQTIVPSFGWLR